MSRREEGATPGLGPALLTLFEYHYAVTTSDGKTTHEAHYWSRCAILEQEADLGDVLIRHEGLGDKIVQGLGMDDIDFEDPEFSKRFVVKARDRRDAYDLIGAGMMRFLTVHQGWHIETNGRLLFIYKTGRLKVEVCEGLCAVSLGMLAQLPRTLVNAARERNGQAPILQAGAASTQSRQQVSDESQISHFGEDEL